MTNSVNHIQNQIDSLIEEAKLELRKSVDAIPDHPVTTYVIKNAHISQEISLIGEELRKRGMFNILEKFWLNLTEETNVLNTTRVNKLNRGISLANTGVSQIIQTKIKEGIFNLYRALTDDAEILDKLGHTSDPEVNTVTIPLYLQFETGLYEKLREEFLIPFSRAETSIPSIENVKNFLATQHASKRLFLFQTISQLFSALRRSMILPNMMSRQDVIKSLSDLCLYLESSLREKNDNANSLHSALNFLGLPSKPGGYHSKNLDELLINIDTVRKIKNISQSRALVSICIRNYSSHNLQTIEHEFFKENLVKGYVADIFYTLLLADSKGKI